MTINLKDKKVDTPIKNNNFNIAFCLPFLDFKYKLSAIAKYIKLNISSLIT